MVNGKLFTERERETVYMFIYYRNQKKTAGKKESIKNLTIQE